MSNEGERDENYSGRCAEYGTDAMKPPAVLPSEVPTKIYVFDRFATYISARS